MYTMLNVLVFAVILGLSEAAVSTTFTWKDCVFAVILGLSEAVSTTFTWKDCAKSENRVLNVGSIHVSPTPLVIPGPLTVSFSANLTKEITNANLILEVDKNLGFFGFVKVPCIGFIGSCQYDMCTMASELGSYLQVTDDIVFKIKQPSCPILAPQLLTVSEFRYTINPGEQFEWLVNGDYHIIARIQDKVSKLDYACLDLNIGAMPGCDCTCN